MDRFSWQFLCILCYNILILYAKSDCVPLYFQFGIGGFHQAMEQLEGGRECVLAAEIDSFIRESIGR